jgi:hypothetical protein
VSHGRFVDFYYTAPQDAASEKVLQSTDNGETWEDAYLPLGIKSASVNGIPKHTVRAAQLEAGKTYLFKVVITGGKNEGESNVITQTVM